MLLAPSFAQEKLKTSGQYGGTLIWGVAHKPTIINPILTTTGVSKNILDLVLNKLIRINSQDEIIPDLAESWNISSDGLVYTFYLRKGIRFHDGVECTAEDVKFTFDAIMNKKTGSPFVISNFEIVDSVSVEDTHTLKITLKNPCIYFLYNLFIEICPKHILKNADLKTCKFNFHPIGTGPFKFKEWTHNNQIILEYNPDYYEGRPYLDRIIIKTYPTSKDTWSALMREEVDFVLFLERRDYDVLKNDASFKTFSILWDWYYAIQYNLDDPVLKDIKVREAIAHGIDRKQIIKKSADGYGLECNGPFYPDSEGFNPLIKPITYDPEKSLQMLKNSGWKDNDNNGILEKQGKELRINLLVDSRNEIFTKIAMIIRQQLQEIGIKLELILYDNYEILTKEFIEENKPQAHLRLFLAGNPAIIVEDWSSKEPKMFDKLWTYNNKIVDSLFKSAETVHNKDKREHIYKKIHQIIYKDQPACFIYFPYQFHGISHKFENIEEFFSLSMPFYTIKNWMTKERR
ncbi:MAG: ABC transporter substrate-binding protein [bacterium]